MSSLSVADDINTSDVQPGAVEANQIITGDARRVLADLPTHAVDLSFWSPPYFVGNTYEEHLDFGDWQNLLSEVISEHTRILRSGGFMVVNIADILCFSDENMPRFAADNLTRKTSPVTRDDVLEAMEAHPGANRRQLAARLGCSEQTVQRRLEGNNARGGKHTTPTRVLLTSGLVEKWALDAGLYLYDRRVWHKDPCWANSRWHSNSYRAVDEFEYVWCSGNRGWLYMTATDLPQRSGPTGDLGRYGISARLGAISDTKPNSLKNWPDELSACSAPPEAW